MNTSNDKPITYDVHWIQKNMGISRKTLLFYESKGLITPLPTDNDNQPLHKYHKYSYEDILRVWYIKLFVEMGFEIKEITSLPSMSDSEFDALLATKIAELEKVILQKEQLLGHLKMIKMTGDLPAHPQPLGSMTLNDFLTYSHKEWNLNNSPQGLELYKLTERLLSSDSELPEIEELPFTEAQIESINGISIIILSIIEQQNLGSGHPVIQNLIGQIYELYCQSFSTKPYPSKQQFSRLMVRSYTTGNIGKLQEHIIGEENRQFLVEAFATFGGYPNIESIEEDPSCTLTP